MKMLERIKTIFKLDGETDRKVNAIYQEPIDKAQKLDDSLKAMNKLLYHKTVNYYIVKAMGVIK